MFLVYYYNRTYVQYNIPITCVLHIKYILYMLTIVYLSNLCLWVYIIYMYKPPSYYWSGANIHHLSLFPSTSYSTSPPRPTPPQPTHTTGRGYHDTLTPSHPQTMGGVGGGGDPEPGTYIHIYIYTHVCLSLYKFFQFRVLGQWGAPKVQNGSLGLQATLKDSSVEHMTCRATCACLATCHTKCHTSPCDKPTSWMNRLTNHKAQAAMLHYVNSITQTPWKEPKQMQKERFNT